jgi:hypothetical protein
MRQKKSRGHMHMQPAEAFCPDPKLIRWLKIQPICYDQTLITSPKTFHNQSIARLFSLRIPDISAGNLAFPYHRHLKSSSPQMPVPDNKIISAVFAGL